MKALWQCAVSQTVRKVSCFVFGQSSILSYEGKSFRCSEITLQSQNSSLWYKVSGSLIPYRIFCQLILTSDCSAVQEYHPGWVWCQNANPLLCIPLKCPGSELEDWYNPTGREEIEEWGGNSGVHSHCGPYRYTGRVGPRGRSQTSPCILHVFVTWTKMSGEVSSVFIETCSRRAAVISKQPTFSNESWEHGGLWAMARTSQLRQGVCSS